MLARLAESLLPRLNDDVAGQEAPSAAAPYQAAEVRGARGARGTLRWRALRLAALPARRATRIPLDAMSIGA